MNKVRLIATDLDGTFLNNDKMVSEKNKEAIHKCKEKGILFGIATGRPADTTKVMVQRWGIEDDVDFIMGMNGGLIYDYHSDTEELYYPLQGSLLQEIIRFYEGYDVIFHVKIGVMRYTNVSSEESKIEANRVGEIEEQVDLIPFLEGKTVSKLNVICDPSYQSIVKERAQEFIKDHPEVTGFPTQPQIFEFVDCRVNKGFGLKKIAEHFHVSIEETLAFGDEENDATLLEVAGCGVCMKNGSDKTKAASDIVSERTNQEDAIAYYLEENVL